jgi:cytochrome c-type biogenesis protein CcmE
VANAKFFVAGGVIALAVAYLVVMAIQGTTVYFLTVNELYDRGSSGQVYRVSGMLVPGSLARDSSGLGINFQIADAGSTKALPVVYRGGQVPDIMGDNVEIVAEGRLEPHGTFTASTVLAKCPSKLENAPPEEHDYTTARAGG